MKDNPQDLVKARIARPVPGLRECWGKSGRNYGWRRSNETFMIHRVDLDPAQYMEVKDAEQP